MAKLNFFIKTHGQINPRTMNNLFAKDNIFALATDQATSSVNLLDGTSSTCPSCDIF